MQPLSGNAAIAITVRLIIRRASGAVNAASKGFSMTNNNRQRDLFDDENNTRGLAHENAFPISGKSDVDENYRVRKSSRLGVASLGSSSGTAYHWLLQSSWGSFASQLSDPRQPSPEPPGDAVSVLGTSSVQVPFQRFYAPRKLLQSFPGAVRRVRRVQLVDASVFVPAVLQQGAPDVCKQLHSGA